MFGLFNIARIAGFLAKNKLYIYSALAIAAVFFALGAYSGYSFKDYLSNRSTFKEISKNLELKEGLDEIRNNSGGRDDLIDGLLDGKFE